MKKKNRQNRAATDCNCFLEKSRNETDKQKQKKDTQSPATDCD